MPANTVREPVAKVTGIYRGKFSGLEPLTIDKPLSMEEVRRNPIFYELDLNPETGDENLIIDLIYDNMAPIRLQDLYRGTDLPRGVRFWPDWFDIPPYEEMRDVDSRRVYPRARAFTPCRSGPRPEAGPDGRESGFQPGDGGGFRARSSSL